jgi:four helix bundle protein
MSEAAPRNPRATDLRHRMKSYGLRIVRLYQALPKSQPAQHFALQVLRSGTSVGAQFAESCWPKSRADFASKINGSLQELEETRFWLESLVDADIEKAKRLQPLLNETMELQAILATMLKRTRQRKGK